MNIKSVSIKPAKKKNFLAAFNDEIAIGHSKYFIKPCNDGGDPKLIVTTGTKRGKQLGQIIVRNVDGDIYKAFSVGLMILTKMKDKTIPCNKSSFYAAREELIASATH